MSRLSDESRALIAQTRTGDDPTHGDRERLRARLGPEFQARAAAPSEHGLARGGGLGKLTALACAALVFAGLAWLSASRPVPVSKSAPRSAAPPQVARPIALAASATPATHAAVAPVLDRVLPKPSEAAPPRKRSPTVYASATLPKNTERLHNETAVDVPPSAARSAAPAPPTAAVDLESSALAPDTHPPPAQRAAPVPSETLADELALLVDAQTAFRQHQPSRALALAERHAFRFPAGSLVRERLAVQALSLCVLQRRAAAGRVFDVLLARDPESALVRRVRQECAF